MNVMRSMLLAASQNRWLRARAGQYGFVRHSISRFMPGETLDDALAAAHALENQHIGSVFTHLGENVQDAAEARQVAEHYVQALHRVREENLRTEISVKPTQLGLDLSPELCFDNLQRIIEHERKENIVWIDMEASSYVDATLGLYLRLLREHENAGVCLQAYLYRTRNDLEKLLPRQPSIRLVKGAYNEPSGVAFPRKSDVDANYFALAQTMLRAKRENARARMVFGTHDVAMIRRIAEFAAREHFAKSDVEVHMLYGIQRAEQLRLAAEGCRSAVLVAYGTYWYPWFMRRLAERPANLWFLLRNLLAG